MLLARLDRPIGIWLLLLPGWWGIAMASGGLRSFGAFEWTLFALFGFGAIIMRSAGCVINDLWDRDLDKNVERTRVRPLASGALNVKQAVAFLFVLLLLGLGILLQLNLLTIMLGFLSFPLIVAYPLMKRFTWWPQAFLGLTFNFGALMGWAAISGELTLPAALLYVSGVLWTLGYDTIYAHQDMEDDALAGIKSTALKFGAHSKSWVGGFYLFSWIGLCGAVFISGAHVYAPLMLVPAGLHLLVQLVLWDGAQPESALRVFKSNRNYGILVLLGLIAGGLLLY